MKIFFCEDVDIETVCFEKGKKELSKLADKEEST